MSNDPICNERGIPQSECPPFCPHDFGPVGPDGFTRLAGYVAEYVNDSSAALRVRVTEAQWNALEMARKADAAERRADEAEFHVEQLRDARDRAERQAEGVVARVEEVLDCADVRREGLIDVCLERDLRAALTGKGSSIRAEALRTAARRFVDDMAEAWGGDAQWLTTGTRVAEVVACVLREMAADLENGDDHA